MGDSHARRRSDSFETPGPDQFYSESYISRPERARTRSRDRFRSSSTERLGTFIDDPTRDERTFSTIRHYARISPRHSQNERDRDPMMYGLPVTSFTSHRNSTYDEDNIRGERRTQSHSNQARERARSSSYNLDQETSYPRPPPNVSRSYERHYEHTRTAPDHFSSSRWQRPTTRLNLRQIPSTIDESDSRYSDTGELKFEEFQKALDWMRAEEIRIRKHTEQFFEEKERAVAKAREDVKNEIEEQKKQAELDARKSLEIQKGAEAERHRLLDEHAKLIATELSKTMIKEVMVEITNMRSQMQSWQEDEFSRRQENMKKTQHYARFQKKRQKRNYLKVPHHHNSRSTAMLSPGESRSASDSLWTELPPPVPSPPPGNPLFPGLRRVADEMSDKCSCYGTEGDAPGLSKQTYSQRGHSAKLKVKQRQSHGKVRPREAAHMETGTLNDQIYESPHQQNFGLSDEHEYQKGPPLPPQIENSTTGLSQRFSKQDETPLKTIEKASHTTQDEEADPQHPSARFTVPSITAGLLPTPNDNIDEFIARKSQNSAHAEDTDCGMNTATIETTALLPVLIMDSDPSDEQTSDPTAEIFFDALTDQPFDPHLKDPEYHEPEIWFPRTELLHLPPTLENDPIYVAPERNSRQDNTTLEPGLYFNDILVESFILLVTILTTTFLVC